ncbi:MAG TPA: multicopper oxidase domain-containing protein [Solirubrobacteraceae bacterium]|nr:multicopper oxidase domain-containing protein [Solirubrobacteraceae bacterium]
MTGRDTLWRPPADAWSRRDLLRNGFASVAFLCALPAAQRGGPRLVTSAALRARARSPFEPFRRDLPLIPELLPVRRTRTTDVYESTIQEGMADILPGFQTPIYGYDGIYPGPTIRARKGRRVVVRQRNTLAFESNVHLHGGYVPARFDGHPMDVIAPGGEFEYRYPNHQDAATLWYHDHAHGRTSRTLYYGLVAIYVLEDDRERELELPAGDYDVPLVIADHAFNKDGSFRYVENVDLGFRGDTILVNGAVAPRMRVDRRKYRFRLLNGSNSRSYDLRLGRGRRMTQIAGDGGLLERPVHRKAVPLHPAERIDLVIDFRDYRPGTELVLHNADGDGSTVAVMRFDVGRGGGREEFRVPRRLRPLESLPAAGADRTWNLGFGSGAWQINGKDFDPDRIDVAPQHRSTERWTFVNRSNRVHPMHIHGFLFRVLERSSGRVHPADRLGWKDTVGVLPNESVTVLAWFGPYSGRYVFHCHALEHADHAMMLQTEVVR